MEDILRSLTLAALLLSFTLAVNPAITAFKNRSKPSDWEEVTWEVKKADYDVCV